MSMNVIKIIGGIITETGDVIVIINVHFQMYRMSLNKSFNEVTKLFSILLLLYRLKL